MAYRYERISPDRDGGTHFRVADDRTDSRIATCYSEENAKLIVAALNGGDSPALRRKAELPASASRKLVEFSVEPKVERGRADDCFVYLSTPTGQPLGRITIGWFREHTDLSAWEEVERGEVRVRR